MRLIVHLGTHSFCYFVFPHSCRPHIGTKGFEGAKVTGPPLGRVWGGSAGPSSSSYMCSSGKLASLRHWWSQIPQSQLGWPGLNILGRRPSPSTKRSVYLVWTKWAWAQQPADLPSSSKAQRKIRLSYEFYACPAFGHLWGYGLFLCPFLPQTHKSHSHLACHSQSPSNLPRRGENYGWAAMRILIPGQGQHRTITLFSSESFLPLDNKTPSRTEEQHKWNSGLWNYSIHQGVWPGWWINDSLHF